MDEQPPQRFGLVEVAEADLEQFEQGEESRDDDQGVLGRFEQVLEVDVSDAQQGQDMPALLGDAHERQVDMVDGDAGRGVIALEHGGEDSGQFAGSDVQLQRRQHVLERRLEVDIAWGADGACGHRLGQVTGHGLVRLVLQQPGEEEVSGLEQLEVEDLFTVFVRQQSGRLEVEQGRGDEEELGDLGEVRLILELGGVGDELIGHLGQRDLRDVEATFRDQTEQQIEGAGEVLQPHLETLRGVIAGVSACGPIACVDHLAGVGVGRNGGRLLLVDCGVAQGAPPRAMSSRASRR